MEIAMGFNRLLDSGLLPLQCNGLQITCVSEPDKGMYDAINKGFALADGDIFAWINADDIYLPGAFATIAGVFSKFDDVHWGKGITSYITKDSITWKQGQCNLYTQDWIKTGVYGRDDYFIQQDSVFWRSWLWKETGCINADMKLAGDYYLWLNFAKLAPLVSIRSMVSCFRHVDGQLSQNFGAYNAEAHTLSPGNGRLAWKIRLFRRYERHLSATFKAFLFRMLFGRLEYSAILIDRNGDFQKITGQRFEVASRL